MRRSAFLIGVALVMSGCSGVNTAPATAGDVTVTEVLPAQGPLAGNIPVQIKGSGFVADNLLVTFGGTAMADAELIDAQTVRGTLPARSQAGVVDVVVACAAGQFSLVDGFEYNDAAAVSITGLNPPNGPLSGGTTVTITGTGFQGANATVAFGGVNGTGVTITSDTSLSVLTPASATGGPVSVAVSNANGTATLPNAFVYGSGGGGGGGGGGVSTVTENLGGVVEFNHVKQGGDPAFSQGYGFFFAASDVSYPSPGTCALDLNQFPNVTTTLDAGANVTIAQGASSMTVPQVSNSYGPTYVLNNAPESSYVLGQMAGVSGPGSTGVAAFNAAAVAPAPSTDYTANMQLGLFSFEGGGFWGAGSDLWIGWTGYDTSPVNHVQLFVVGADLAGTNHVLQCDLREGGDTGSFCIGAGSGGDLCQTPGAKMSDLWTAMGGGFNVANVILYRGNRSTFPLPGGANAALDVSVVKVGSMVMSD